MNIKNILMQLGNIGKILAYKISNGTAHNGTAESQMYYIISRRK